MDVAKLTLVVEGKPAPEPLLAVQALIDSRVILRGEERIGDPSAAAAWLTDVGLLAPGATVSPRELEELIAMREALREAIEERDGVAGSSPTGIADLESIAARHPVPVGFTTAGPQVGLAPAADVDTLISQLLGIMLVSSPEEWRRLKICGARDCRWAFYDRAKNRSGTWCSMESCGNRAKARAHRARAAR
ncbi:CGNR zinc finger domain-containing protein [Thermoleophilia bacterium SCSIO 60948]|nr:CGNR zinc finger domain-containing protein [Thermoleophilia bacterium SCSIO 60948]